MTPLSEPQPAGPAGGYAALLAAARRDPDAADYTALRRACVAAPEYNPYGHLEELEAEPEAAPGAALEQALEVDDFAGALRELERQLARNYLDARTHLMTAFLQHQLGRREREEFHLRFSRGLVESVLDSGDGRAFETAFRVIAVAEEYAVLQALGLEPVQQSLCEHRGRRYDVLDARHPKSGRRLELFFDVETPMRWMDEQLQEDEAADGSPPARPPRR